MFVGCMLISFDYFLNNHGPNPKNLKKKKCRSSLKQKFNKFLLAFIVNTISFFFVFLLILGQNTPNKHFPIAEQIIN